MKLLSVFAIFSSFVLSPALAQERNKELESCQSEIEQICSTIEKEINQKSGQCYQKVKETLSEQCQRHFDRQNRKRNFAALGGFKDISEQKAPENFGVERLR